MNKIVLVFTACLVFQCTAFAEDAQQQLREQGISITNNGAIWIWPSNYRPPITLKPKLFFLIGPVGENLETNLSLDQSALDRLNASPALREGEVVNVKIHSEGTR